MAEVTGTATIAFTCKSRTCGGCGAELLAVNAWMEDGCPCNSEKGCNDGNQLISDWRMLRISELNHEVQRLQSELARGR